MTEQIEFHVFGGSGSAGVTSSLVSLGRSFTAFIILLPIMYYACENDNKDALGHGLKYLFACAQTEIKVNLFSTNESLLSISFRINLLPAVSSKQFKSWFRSDGNQEIIWFLTKNYVRFN